MVVLLLFGCKTDNLIGTVFERPYEDEVPLAGATIVVEDSLLEPFSSTTVGPDGVVLVEKPRGEGFVVTVEHPDMVPTGFLGPDVTGDLKVPDGELFGFSRERHSAIMTRFAGCSEPGGMVYGEARINGLVPEGGDEEVLVTSAFASVTAVDGTVTNACYLDDDGEAWSPNAPDSGNTGQMAIFGLEEGFYQLDYGYYVYDDFALTYGVVIYVPENGVTPLFPAVVELYLP